MFLVFNNSVNRVFINLLCGLGQFLQGSPQELSNNF